MLLSSADHDKLRTVNGWLELLRRDWGEERDASVRRALGERFRWSQGRSPVEYVERKYAMLLMAELHASSDEAMVRTIVSDIGEKDLRDDVERFLITQGKIDVPTLVRAITGLSRVHGGDRPDRRKEARARESALALADRKGGSPNPARARERIKAEAKDAGKRQWKCLNYPRCGDGEHWDGNCPLKPKPKGAYAAGQDCDIDSEASVEELLGSVADEAAEAECNVAVIQLAPADPEFDYFRRRAEFLADRRAKATNSSAAASVATSCAPSEPARSTVRPSARAAAELPPDDTFSYLLAVAKVRHDGAMLRKGESDLRLRCCLDSGYGDSFDRSRDTRVRPSPLFEIPRSPSPHCLWPGWRTTRIAGMYPPRRAVPCRRRHPSGATWRFRDRRQPLHPHACGYGHPGAREGEVRPGAG